MSHNNLAELINKIHAIKECNNPFAKADLAQDALEDAVSVFLELNHRITALEVKNGL